jgi:BA14K-like protein
MLSNVYPGIRPFRTCLLASALALAGAGVAGPAFASTPYDGHWSVVITTRAGACEPTVRYGVEILDGSVVNSTGSNQADVSGQVSRRGIMRVSVRAGGAWADGSGRLGMYNGSGVWRGEGSSGACEGTWEAERRGPAGETANPGPIAPSVACERFRSYDPATGTYLGDNGVRHSCR